MAYTKKRLFNNRCNAVTDCVLVRHSGVDTGGIAHFAGGPDAEVIVIAILPYELGLEYAVRTVTKSGVALLPSITVILKVYACPFLMERAPVVSLRTEPSWTFAVKVEDAPFNVTVMVDSPMAAPFSWKL